MPLSSTVMRSP